MAKTLSIDKSRVLKVYNDSDNSTRHFLETLFGKREFLPIQVRVTSYETACEELGISADLPFEFDDDFNPFYQEVVARYKLSVIAKALQEGWQPDWSKAENKWYVWFEYKAGEGFVVADAGCARGNTRSGVGSRLCFPTSDMARYFGEQFIELHRIALG